MDIRQVKGPDIVLETQAAVIGVFTLTVETNVFNDADHGLSDGDCINVKAATTIPTGLAVSTDYYVIEAAAGTFQVALTPGGDAVAVTDDGTGDLTWAKVFTGAAIDVSLYQHPIVMIDINSLADVTLFVVGSHSKTSPTFLNPKSATNSYDNLNLIDQEDAAAIAGDTGIGLAAADHRYIAVNTNGMHWVAIRTLDFFAGTLDVKVKSYSNT